MPAVPHVYAGVNPICLGLGRTSHATSFAGSCRRRCQGAPPAPFLISFFLPFVPPEALELYANYEKALYASL